MSNETFTRIHDVPPGHVGWRVSRDYILSPEELPNIERLVIEDGQPVDNIFAEKQYRLLTESLYSSWTPPSGPFLALANVGLFFSDREEGLAPDAMLSLGVPTGRDLMLKENRSYFIWVVGKPPDVVIEIVSDLRGGEETDKMIAYARIGITYYVIFDPLDRLHHGLLRAYYLSKGKYEPMEASWLETVGLGLTFWEGEFEGEHARWLRWCDQDGVVIPTGRERAEQEKQRAEQEKQRAEQEKQRAEQEKQRAERLAAQLRALGVEPGA